MKKIALAAVLAGVSSMASANLLNTDNLYVQGNVGYSKLQAKQGDKISDNNTSYSVAVGKDLGDVRVAIDYTGYGKVERRDRSFNTTRTLDNRELKTQSVGISAIYDFQPVSGFTPYVGGRLGINQLKYEGATARTEVVAPNTVMRTASTTEEKKTGVGAGVLAGVQYNINPQLAVDAGVEYNYLGKIGPFDAKVDQYGAKLGLRYNF
ncbi:opacity family porin [Moraxella cuniculi]|uniref:Opacity protein and related surface antigens n=1 Tax=Moraxella cuniculi TaxID=34061 RepID=A0A3S4QNX7_9GAMM|nr:opacity family porin [Moraxella cuniculi]VEG12717.1 Opacity protein and related surface antigens [Moraxella cuniculi]